MMATKAARCPGTGSQWPDYLSHFIDGIIITFYVVQNTLKNIWLPNHSRNRSNDDSVLSR